MSDKKTDFGYQQVSVHEKHKRVSAVFDSVASRYDLMNDLMSLGWHRAWKRFFVQMVAARPGHNVLDLAAGTGDISRRLGKAVLPSGHVYLADLTAAMLQEGRDRFLDQGLYQGFSYVQANAEVLPFASDSFDRVTMAFGLRNVTTKEKVLAEALRVVKPGGQFLVLEFSRPVLGMFRELYDRYSFALIPKLGQCITGDAASYQYLVESIRRHPDQASLQQLFEAAGFSRCSYHNLTGGVVAIHRGYKL